MQHYSETEHSHFNQKYYEELRKENVTSFLQSLKVQQNVFKNNILMPRINAEVSSDISQLMSKPMTCFIWLDTNDYIRHWTHFIQPCLSVSRNQVETHRWTE